MIGKIHNHHSAEEKTQICQEYIEALEEERRKIQVFQRELPLCLELVTQAIESCKQQLSGTTPERFQGQSECSEQTSGEIPVLEEFMPVKRNSSCDDDEEEEEEDDEEEEESEKPTKNYNYKSIDKSSKKSDWLKSVQLWNQTPDLPPIEESSPRKVSVIEVKRNGNGGAFHPFKKEKSGGTSTATNSPCSVPAAAAGSSSTETAGGCGGGGGNKEDKEGQSQRKARRCWSPELHRRFLNALQQLGGSHVATPKQIRELMKVDGLTNDEVKSHLQKYRLHTRRPTPSMHNDNNPQQPQFVVVGGIWVPPPEYAAVATATPTPLLSREESSVAAPKSIYAPIAAPPPPAPQTAKSRTPRQQCKQLDSDQRASRSHDRDRGIRCNSSATSSSARTSTASLAF
ncbi:hypothetical protein RHGRI_026951 [Rhododendron griersonianum]|uniref:HTH myb-type domain-containing protein n=1 Tax=Rhododendron griersonianum TaxID=479676 RepID=A0AAV6IYC3_9ERIC|nr:hypothetical protein RHGRI_026951 [Rhododendron griersonianum]